MANTKVIEIEKKRSAGRNFITQHEHIEYKTVYEGTEAPLEEKYLTTTQVAERLQVVEKTVQRWITSGELQAVKLGRVWRIGEGSLQQFLASRQSPTKN